MDRSTQNAPFALVFQELRGLLVPYAPHLSVAVDAEAAYYLNTFYPLKSGKPLFFAAAQIRKRYVSYHLMPVYVNPGLLDPIGPALKRRMQGKSCFNFAKTDAALFAVLAELTQAGFAYYVEEGYVEQVLRS